MDSHSGLKKERVRLCAGKLVLNEASDTIVLNSCERDEDASRATRAVDDPAKRFLLLSFDKSAEAYFLSLSSHKHFERLLRRGVDIDDGGPLRRYVCGTIRAHSSAPHTLPG
jgi:hypothetical protein